MTARLVASVLVPFLVLLLASPAAAQEEEPEWDDSYYPFAREGIYFGLSAHYALENFDTDPSVSVPGVGTSGSAEDAGGFGFRLGYRAHPRVAAEILFQYFWGFEIQNSVTAGGTSSSATDEFDGFGLTANAKFYAFLGRLQPYGVVGVGGLSFDNKKDDGSGFIARIGGGLDLYISDSFLIDAEIAYVFPGGSMSELQFATFAVGVQYRY